MWLRKTAGVPASAPGGFTWGHLDDVVEVPDELGADLLAIPGAGFAEAEPPQTGAAEEPVEEPAAETAEPEIVEAPAPKKRASRKPAAPSEVAE